MKRIQTNCPSCGGPLEFQAGGAMVAICDFCHTAVGRSDRALEDYGKVAEVGDPASGLKRGMTGRFNGKRFTIAGRVRYRHAGGGSWDEWYLSFGGQQWAWLAEAQGKFSITRKHTLKKSQSLPEFDSIELNKAIPLKNETFTVREKGVATAEGAEGELPWQFHPGSSHHYVDLIATDNAVSTFDYGDGSEGAEQAAYMGKMVTLEELGIDLSSLDPNAGVQSVGSLQLNCPQCGGPLKLRAPDQTLRVACPNCSSLLDASEGKLTLFQTLTQKRLDPLIPLGSEGTIGGVKFTLIGYMKRHVLYQGQTFPWTEYLLYNRETGFRWLVCQDYHWSFVAPVDEPVTRYGQSITYDGETFRLYDRGTAHVSYVLGEFYWQVNVGDQTETFDYIAPPRMLSFETTGWGDTQEVTVSEGQYMAPEEIEAIFGVKDLPRPWGVGVLQSAPTMEKSFWLTWIGGVVYLLLVYGVFSSKADAWLLTYALVGVSLFPMGFLLYRRQFEVQRWSDSDFSPYLSSDD
ncbi:hypothetical protein SV7mr_32310 [Stieleria bergensis]|uniref:DUF4178 domain-containing protein n=1 Tax=Stieleria bergensis TaxID=2528025 RepID=A0A517SX35_9BACT|nr:hypothetical protein SV7mr_32310 [Planctomycetes bacterium SV_7m_r]